MRLSCAVIIHRIPAKLHRKLINQETERRLPHRVPKNYQEIGSLPLGSQLIDLVVVHRLLWPLILNQQKQEMTARLTAPCKAYLRMSFEINEFIKSFREMCFKSFPNFLTYDRR